MVYNAKLNGAVLKGTNVKRNGALRSWDARCTGNFFKGKGEDYMVEVIETGCTETRNVNMSTFSGVLALNGCTKVYRDGVRIDAVCNSVLTSRT
ncbi:MAG: hypothetical protein GF334_08965 [Candidatus Altiarchaeales archaeon]|nr:hypothetical protein [Candidatus Altiarchaeales archaeon]